MNASLNRQRLVCGRVDIVQSASCPMYDVCLGNEEWESFLVLKDVDMVFRTFWWLININVLFITIKILYVCDPKKDNEQNGYSRLVD